MPLVNVFSALDELQPQQVLVDLQHTLGDCVHREVLFQQLFVHRVPGLLDQRGVVVRVPKVQLAVELVAVFFALKQQLKKIKIQ